MRLGALGGAAVAVPVAWQALPSDAVPAAGGSPGPVGPPTGDIRPIAWDDIPTTGPTDPVSVRLREILRNASRYAAGPWYGDVKGFAGQTGDHLDFGGTAERDIRPASAQAFGLATALALGIYRTDAGEPTAREARDITVRLVSSLAFRHAATSPDGWGDDWQTAHWAAFTGFAGWLVWDDLDTDARDQVWNMVEHEADRFTDYAVPAYRSVDGRVVSPGDTKGEENAWNSQLLQVATAMAPDHPRWNDWMRKSIELMVSATSRPKDLDDRDDLHGRPLSNWIDGRFRPSPGGTNANDDGTMVNHGRVHPDYMETFVLTTHAALVYSLADMPTPRAAMHNADVIYRALVDVNFEPGTNPYSADPEVTGTVAEPGGTIYRPGTAEVFYPYGNDYGPGRRMQFVGMDALAGALGVDRSPTRPGNETASRPAEEWLDLHSAAALAMQQRWEDGHTYDIALTGADTEDSYDGREEWVSHHAAWAVLARTVSFHGLVSIGDDSY